MKKLLAVLITLGLCIWVVLIVGVVLVVRGDQPGQKIAAFSRSILAGLSGECRLQTDHLGVEQPRGTDRIASKTKLVDHTRCRS